MGLNDTSAEIERSLCSSYMEAKIGHILLILEANYIITA